MMNILKLRFALAFGFEDLRETPVIIRSHRRRRKPGKVVEHLKLKGGLKNGFGTVRNLNL